MTQQKVYSLILQEFIEPIVTGDESEDGYFEKCLLGHVVWNFCIATEHKLPIVSDVFEVLNERYLSDPGSKKLVDLLRQRWTQSFHQYNRFIMLIERRYSNDSPTIYVETVLPEFFTEVGHHLNAKFVNIPFAGQHDA